MIKVLSAIAVAAFSAAGLTVLPDLHSRTPLVTTDRTPSAYLFRSNGFP
jgi:hypothetical protein